MSGLNCENFFQSARLISCITSSTSIVPGSKVYKKALRALSLDEQRVQDLEGNQPRELFNNDVIYMEATSVGFRALCAEEFEFEFDHDLNRIGDVLREANRANLGPFT